MTSAPVLTVEGVRAALNGGVWCGLSAALEPGSITRLAGPSGCGKTTLLRTLARLQRASGGRLLLDGHEARRIPAPQWRRAVAYLPQRAAMLPGSVGTNLRAGFHVHEAHGAPYDAGAGQDLLDQLRLPATVLSQDARTLSGGEAARVALVRGLLLQPRVLLLDECTAALDEDAAAALVALATEYVRAGARAALVVAHNPEVWNHRVTATVHVERGT